MSPINNSTNITNRRFPSTHSRSHPQLGGVLLPLPLVIFLILFLFLFVHLPLVNSTLFANDEGFSSDQRIHVTGVDVKEILRTTRDTSADQGVSIDGQATDLMTLRSKIAVMRADVTRLNVVLTEQARLLERQAFVLEQQRVMLASLEAYTHNNTLRLASIDADAGVQTDRTALGEFVTERLTRNVTDHQDAARRLNQTVAVEHATNLTSLDGTVVMHQSEIDTLQSVDSTLIATATELSHNATRLSDRVADLISSGSTLTDRMTASESTLAGLSDRMVTLEADAAVIGLVQSRHYLSINELESTSANHTTRLQQLEDAAAIAQSNIDTLKQHDIDTTVILAAIANAAMSLRARVTEAESITPGSSQLVDQVLNAQQRALLQASHIVDLEAALKAANASIVQRQTNEELAVEGLKQRIDGLESDTATLQSNTENNSTRLRTSTTYVTDLVINFRIPKMYRYIFLQSSTWTVPAGVTSAFVTLAGGGGSGYGWRIVNALNTGSSGGYLFSTPVTLVPGETITVTVGRGGFGVKPSPRAGQPPNVYFAPIDDDGFKGNAGLATVLTSAINGDLIQCSGAAGASVGRYDGLTGTTIPSLDGVGQQGFWTGSGKGQYFVPSVPSGGPYGVTWGPGVCGPDSLGIGNPGLESYLTGSGTFKGGKTPFGYGSGGDVGRWGCYVSPSVVGTCIFPETGRDGIAFIDVMY